jgi:hypothetical protein
VLTVAAGSRTILLLSALLFVGSCGGSDSPGETHGTISAPLNSIVDGSVSGTTTNHYEFKAVSRVEFSVLFQVVSGSVILDLEDGTGTRLSTLDHAGTGEPLGQHSTPLITANANSVYRIDIHGQGQYRFEVYSASPSPEHASPDIAIGDTVASEDLHAASDVDEFHLTGTAGDELIGYLQAGDQVAPGVLQLVVSGPGSNQSVIAAASSAADQRPFEFNPTSRFTLAASGIYTIRVFTALPQAGTPYVGPYKFQIRRIDRNPERVAATIAAGSTVTGEGLEYVGDIDRFTLAGIPGEELDIDFQATHGDTTSLLLDVSDVLTTDPSGNPVNPTVVSRGTDSVLTDQSSFRFRVPSSGHATIQVAGQTAPGNGGPQARGSYLIRVNRVNRSPETAPATLAIGDSVTVERIEVPGDIDEYSVSAATSDTVNIVIELDSTTYSARKNLTTGLATTLGTAGSGSPGAAPNPSGIPVASASGTFVIAPGQYVLRVLDPLLGIQGWRSYSGPYRLFLYRIRSKPETAPGVLAIGDSVTEAISPIGDVDVFTFPGNKGDYVDLQLQGLGAPSQSGYQYRLYGPGNPDPLGSGSVPTSSAWLSDSHTGRITLPATGTYRISVVPNSGGSDPTERGPYRLALLRLNGNPEHHAGAIALGEVVADEALDGPDDVDEFTLHTLPGTEVALFVKARTGLVGITAEALVPATKDTIRTISSFGSRESTGRFLVPASGDLLIRVSDPRRGTGPYDVQVFPINRAPELTSPVYAVGDTVRDEPIDALGADIDEYHFTGAAGQRLVAHFQTPLGVQNPGLILELLAPVTQQVLGSLISILPTANLDDRTTGVITLPVSGQYLIRVRGVDDRSSAGPYRFSIQSAP